MIISQTGGFRDGNAMHNGNGKFRSRTLLGKEHFNSPVKFLAETILAPGSSIGVHRHMGNEEVYLIVEGEGVMTVDDEQRVVKPGQAVLTQSGSSHGIRNNSDRELRLFVFEADCCEGRDKEKQSPPE